MGCGHDDCFTCPYEDCIDGETKEKPKERKKYDRKPYYKQWYAENRVALAERRRANYFKKKEQRMLNNKERIRALIGNLKHHDWDLFPQFRLEKEDAEALRDTQALQEYINDKAKNRVKE